MAQAFDKASQDKTVKPAKRFEFRREAKRWRALAKWAREEESRKDKE